MTDDQVITLVQGNIKTVDKDADTCVFTPLDGGADFLDVKLEALENVDGSRSEVVRYPEEGCYAIIGLMNNDPLDTFLIKASRYESVVILIAKQVKITASGDGNVTVDAQNITMNGGNNKGLVNLVPLVQKINSLEKTVNAHIAAFKVHTHLGVTVGTGVSGITGTAAPDSISPLTKSSELEDTNILH